LRVGGNADFDATLNVDGNATVGGTLAVTGTASAANAVADSDLITKGQSDTRDDSLANAIAGNDQDIIDLNGRADSLANAVAGNDSDIVDLNGRADSLANAVAGNDSDIVDLNDRADSLANAVAGNDTDITTLNTTQDSLETAISSNDTDIATLNTTQDSLENAISSNDTELDSIFARADSIINVLYWNNNAGVLSHDADIDSVDVDGVLQVNGNSDLNGDLDVSGSTDIDGTLDVAKDANFQSEVHVNDSLVVNGDSDMNGTLDVSGNTDIDGTLDAQGATNLQSTLTVNGFADLNDSLDVAMDANFQSTVHIQDSLVVNGDSDMNGTLDVSGNTDIDGSLNVQMGTHLQDTLYVAGFANFDDSLDVQESVNIQDNLDVNDSLALNTAENEGTVFSVTDSKGGTGVSIVTVDVDGGASSATTLTTHRLIVQDDAVYNGDMTISGALAVTNNVTSAALPTSPNNLTNKQYVDDAIAAALTPPQMWDYEAVNSTSGDTIYYINGDLLLYGTEEDGLVNYTIKVYGEDLNQIDTDMEITGVRLRARGNARSLTGTPYNWTSNSGGGAATFDIGYTDIKALAGGQENGYVSCSLQFEVEGGQQYNSGLTIRFYLDKENVVATAADFSNPAQ
jgi:cytoskeletal protein CcmA (bactofilin family)